MQADNIREGVRDLTKKLVALDPIESHAAINQYFDTNCVVDSPSLSITGSSRIKKQSDLINRAFSGSELVGEPKYNEQEQTVEFTFQRLFQAPTLPNVLQHTPIISRLSGAQQAIHYDAKLHLNPDGSGKKSDEAPMMLVTKMDIDRREKAPLENLVPYSLLRPLLSVASNVIASIASIAGHHPSTPGGLISTTTECINQFVLWLYDKFAHVKARSFPSQPAWASGGTSNLPPIATRAYATATDIGQNLEARARKLGVPVNEYKDKVTKVASDLQHRAEDAVEYIYDQAQGATNRGQLSRPQTSLIADNVSSDHAHSGGGAHAHVNGDDHHRHHERPATPLGDINPNAEGAPSYAEAASNTSIPPLNRFERKG